MLGTKIYKPLTEETEAQYTQAAEWCNNNNATIEDVGGYYEVVAIIPPSQEEINAEEIKRLKAELAATDYKCLKFVDGALTEEEYADVRTYRASLRQQINELEGDSL